MKFFFHLGFFKTATTFVEDNYYSKNKFINYINNQNKYEIEKIIYFIKNSTKKEYKKNFLKFSKIIENLNWSENKINVISMVGITDVLSQKDIYLDINIILKRLNLLFKYTNKNTIKILVSFREQKSFLLARFSENIDNFIKTKKEWSNFNKFQKTIKLYSLRKRTEEKVFFESLKYYLLLKKCIKVFGKQNVRFIDFAILQNNSILYLKYISKFMEIRFDKQFDDFLKPKNISLKQENIYFLKSPKIKKIFFRNLENKNIFNIFIFKKMKTFLKIIFRIIFFNIKKIFLPQKIELSDKFILEMNNYYRNDNIKLKKNKKLVIS